MLVEMLAEAREQELNTRKKMAAYRMEFAALREVERLEAQLIRARARAAMPPRALTA